MKDRFEQWLKALGLAALCALAACGGGSGGNGNGNGGGNVGGNAPRLAQSHSTTIALTGDNAYVWSVNPDNDSVSMFEVAADRNHKLAEVSVGYEPRCVAITPDDKKVYVTNAVSGTVSVIDAAQRAVVKTIAVGTEPTGCALTLDGAKLYVANLSSDSVSVIDTGSDAVTKTITGVGAKPRAIAIAETGGKTKVYVTQFLAQLVDDARSVDQKEGRDDGREGRVSVIDASTDTLARTIKLAAKATGFQSDGSTLDKIVFDGTAATKVNTLAFPNQLESIVVRGNRAYLPNTASSPNGPVKFNVNVQGFMSVIDIDADAEVVAETFNMNKGVQFEAVGKKLFPTNPAALAFKHGAAFEGFVLSRATDRLVRLALDANGRPTINAPQAAGDPGSVVRIEVGVDAAGGARNSSPEGVVINGSDTRAYVMNLVTRDVSVIDIAGSDPAQYKEIARIASAALPTDAFALKVLRGKELFNTSIGPEGTNDNAKKPAGRMSDFGWGSCYGCHPRGLTDGVTWMFGDGPRQTISMESTVAHPQLPVVNVNVNGNFAPLLPALHQRALNWSAVRDEIQDFELNIRNVSGGQGLIALKDPFGDRAAVDPCVFNLRFTVNAACTDATREAEAATTTGRDADLDALAAYIAFGIRAPITPTKANDPDVHAGRALFAAANCQGCHGGANWTSSTLDFAPPPLATEITAAQLSRFLCKAGTFNVALANELKGGAVAGQLNTDAANGALGINIPSLLSAFAGAPYFHSGAATTLDDVLANVQHRSLGTAGVDMLGNAADRAKLAKFVGSIDAGTPTFPERSINDAKALCLP
jgi:YVTN family beta-propeller protein